MLSERQEKLLNFLVQEYLHTTEPVGSLSLKKISDLDVSAATIRNDLQELTEAGYITQPHTSAGRVPTEKAYRYLAQRIESKKQKEFDDFIVRQIKEAQEEMEAHMAMMEELMQNLEQDNLFEILTTIEKWHKKII